jgi:gamma-glutamyltranspeptidase / glutathione hydrolase
MEMRFIEAIIPGAAGQQLAIAASWGKRSLIRDYGQFVSVFLMLALAACSSNPLAAINPFQSKEDESQRGTIGFVRGFLGGVVTDEPRAALVGREVLSAGGTAADAAVAVSLALSVTLPSSASLGGGGVCVVHDAKSKRTEILDFQVATTGKMSPTAVHPVAVPGLIRGMGALHAKYGRLQWAQLVTPAEQLARFGNQVSRAFANDLRKAAPTLAEPGMRKIFAAGKDGAMIREGDYLKQPDLSSVLGRIRARGAGDFYAGLAARQFIAAVANAGGSLSFDDLRAFSPQWRPTIRVPYIKNADFHFPTPPGPAGVLAAQMMGMLVEDGKWERAPKDARAHLMAEVTGRAFANRDRWLRVDGTAGVSSDSLVARESISRLLAGYRSDRHTAWVATNQTQGENPDSPAGTGFVAVDREGSAAACTLTLNNQFGVGLVADGMGIILAALPGPRGRGPDSLVPMLLINNLHGVFYLAAAASGGTAAPSALVNVVTNTLLGKDEETLEMAVTAKRIHNDGISDLTFYEQGLDTSVAQSLANKGHRVGETAKIGLVNVIFCRSGIPSRDEVSCESRSDPRGFGLAAGSE